MIPSMDSTDTQTKPDIAPPPLIILFDGTCGLCDRVVQFILKHDTQKRFRFAPQQSQVARELLAQHDLNPEQIDSVVLIDGEHAYLRSSAALRIATELPEPWSMAGLLVFLPVTWRDAAYDYIAKHRKQWFKSSDECRMPTEQEREQFLT